MSDGQPSPETLERFVCLGLVWRRFRGVFPLQPNGEPLSVWLCGIRASCRTLFLQDGEHAVAVLVLIPSPNLSRAAAGWDDLKLIVNCSSLVHSFRGLVASLSDQPISRTEKPLPLLILTGLLSMHDSRSWCSAIL